MRKIGTPLFIFLALVVTSCLKVETYPDEPSIEAVRLTVSSDSAFLQVDFIDGDGNVGLGQSDTSGVFGACDTRYNLFCVYEELRNGTWMQISEEPCLNPNAVPFYYRVPWATPPALIHTKGLLENLHQTLTKHYCRQCGYNSDNIFWRCPQCHEWETIQFRWKV